MEAKCQSLDERVAKLEANETEIRKLANEEYDEMKEIESFN